MQFHIQTIKTKFWDRTKISRIKTKFSINWKPLQIKYVIFYCSSLLYITVFIVCLSQKEFTIQTILSCFRIITGVYLQVVDVCHVTVILLVPSIDSVTGKQVNVPVGLVQGDKTVTAVNLDITDFLIMDVEVSDEYSSFRFWRTFNYMFAEGFAVVDIHSLLILIFNRIF